MKQMSKRDLTYVRVAIAKATLAAIDSAIDSLRMQRRAARALVDQRLQEHTLAILAEQGPPEAESHE